MKTKFGELAGQIMKSHSPLTLPRPSSVEKHELKESVMDPLLLLYIAYSLNGRSGHRKAAASRLISSSVEQVFETVFLKQTREKSVGERNTGGISRIKRLLLEFAGKVSSLGKYDPGNAAKVRDLQDRNMLSESSL